MKRLVLILLLTTALLITACGTNKVIEGKEIGTYGLLNAQDERNPKVKYKVIWGNVIWGCLLAETIIAPVYFFGFSIFEPVEAVEPTPQGAAQ